MRISYEETRDKLYGIFKYPNMHYIKKSSNMYIRYTCTFCSTIVSNIFAQKGTAAQLHSSGGDVCTRAQVIAKDLINQVRRQIITASNQVNKL